MSEFAELERAIAEPEFSALEKALAVPAKTVVPQKEDDDFSALAKGIDTQDSYEYQAPLKYYLGGESVDDRDIRNISRKIMQDERNAKQHLKELEGEGEETSSLERAWGFVKGVGGTVANALTSGSTLPSRAIEEQSAKLTKEGGPTVDIERALGSTVNLVTSLFPGGTTPSEAIRDFSVMDTEGARAKMKRILSKPIIGENNLINKERLDYSDLNRWMQNELSTVWAMQRTGVNNREFWKTIIQSRAGVLAEDQLGAGAKRVGQIGDAMFMNAPTYLLGKAVIGGDEKLFKKYGGTTALPSAISLGQVETMQSGKPDIFEAKGKYYAKAVNGDVVLIEDFDPNAPEQEQARMAKFAIFNDTKKQLEYQAQEAALQALDPSLLIGAGVIKKGVIGGLRAAGATKLALKAAQVIPEAGIVERSARLLARPSSSFLGVESKLARATLDTMKSDTLKGALLRNADKAITGAAYASGLGALGAPDGDKAKAAVAAGLIALGMSPIAMLGKPRKDEGIFNTANKNAMREVLNNEDITKLSDYSRKLVEKDMKRKGLGNNYAAYRDYAMSPEAMQDLASHYTDWLSKEDTTPSMIITAAQDLASNPAFQKIANDATIMMDNYGVSWYGHHVKSAMMKVLKEARNYAAEANNARTPGSASVVPQAVSSKFAIKGLADNIRNIPAELINNPEMFNKWIDNEIAGGPPIPNTPPNRLSADVALALKAQVNAFNLEKIYQPLAHISFISNIAMREASATAKGMNAANMVNNYTDLVAHFRELPDTDKMKMLQDLEVAEKGTPTEGIIHLLNRRLEKPEQWNVSPAAASKVLAENYLENAKEKSLLAAQIDEQRILEASAPNPAVKAVHKKVADDLQVKYDAIKNDAFVYQMYKFATDKAQEFVAGQGAIRNEKLSRLKAEAAAESRRKAYNRKALPRKYWLHQKLLLEKSRLDAITDADVLNKMVYGLQDKKMLQEITAANQRKIAKEELSKTRTEQMAEDILNGTVPPRFTKPQRFSDPAAIATNKYKRTMSDIKETDRKIALTNHQKTVLDQRSQEIMQTIDKMDVDAVMPTTHRKEALDWFDEETALAGNLGIEKSNLYQNIRREILDTLEKRIADKDSGLRVMQEIPKNLVAALRVMGDEAILRDVLNVNMEKNKSNARAFKGSVNALADKLEQASDRSLITMSAIDEIKAAIENPSKTNLSQLLKAQRNLTDTLFMPEMLKDMRSGNGVYAKLETLVNEKSKGYLKKDDWRTLQVLVADSPIGKGFRKAKELEGIVEPWMITYSQDVANMLDQFFMLSGDVVSKSIDETRQFLVDTHQIANPTDFDVVAAAAFLMSIGDRPGAVRPAMMDLVGLANAWRESASRGANEWNTTENIAVGLSRQMGIDIEADMRAMFRGATEAATQRDFKGRALLNDLEKISSGRTRYVDHMEPKSPIRRLLNLTLIGTIDRAVLNTPFVQFVMNGYNKGIREFIKSDVKSAISPMDIKELNSTAYLTDHIVVDGELTAFGKAYKEWNAAHGVDATTFIDDYMNIQIPTHLQNTHRAEFRALKQFLVTQFNWYGKLANMEEFNVYEKAVQTIQKHDKEGITHINELNEAKNKEDGTAYPRIEYNPWRLDTQVPTRNDDITHDSMLFGTFADADRIMGNRYATTPENQIAKAQASGIVENSLFMSPEEMYLNRYSRLYNEMLSRKARASLSRKAMLIEHMGFRELATDVKKYVVEAGQIDAKGRSWFTRLGDSITESSNKAVMASGFLLRQLFNPFIVLASPIATIIEQPIQTALLQVGTLPTFQGLANGADSAGRYWKAYALKWFSGVFESIRKNTEKLNVVSNGKNIKIEGPYAAVLEKLWEGHSKRVDPYFQAMMQEANRGGTGKMKELSRQSSVAAYTPEGTAKRMMFTLKERAENTQIRALMPQIGAIWQTAMDAYKKDGAAAMYNHLTQFMEGPFANPALQRDIVKAVELGRDVEALGAFGSHYLAQNAGTWNHTNVPKAIRSIAHHVVGADQFFTAQTLGIYRVIGAISNLTYLTPEQKARTIASAVATLAIAGGLGALSDYSEIDWFQRLSPVQGVSKAWVQLSQKDKAFSLATNIGTRVEIKSGMSQAMGMRAIYAGLGLIKTYMMSDTMTEKDEVTKYQERKRLQQQLISLLLDNSAARPVIAAATLPLGGLTPAEATKSFQDLALPIIGSGLPGENSDSDLFNLGLYANVFDERDAFILRQSLDSSFKKADKLASRMEQIEAQEGGKIRGSVESLGLFAIEQFARISLAMQEEAWEAYAPWEFQQTPFDRDPGWTADERMRREIIARGVAGRDARSEQYVRMLEAEIRRYDARDTQNREIISGVKQPVSNEQPYDPLLRATPEK